MARYSSTYFPSCYATAALTTLLIFGSFGFHGMTTCSAARIHIHKKASTNFIATKCSTTTNPRLCVDTLASHASTIQDNPSLLARTAISVCLASAQSTSAVLSSQSTTGGLGAGDAGAVGDCKTTMGDSADKLQKSLDAMGSLRGKKGINDIQTWMSTALTDVAMCREGLEASNMDGSVKSSIVNAEQLTSIALAFVNGLSPVSP
uniref:21 kDa protein n=1 Tax=Elaeis guineensis var. tenera TaxID=51953 RepID=A0A6I9R2Q0_ELAGV|nr:21 kDa protein [Elaeis guineensis]